ncbi:LysR substrate-binding domain-containing protein [Streptosporangium sp. CA-135522]|uniref:LysR substrate-binding domain-containing protein n=1 Tax=Streptosporangium sp. CA-135522 TaxID=3240072 RepID=UPI003D9459E6
MQLNLHRLWIFLQVLEYGGFSAAAQKLYMSQPSVSGQVQQLEKSLHATLVDRSGARVRATAEGEVLAEYARRIFLLADEAVTAIERVQGLATGRIAVAGTSTVGTYLLPTLLARFVHKYPGIEHSLQVGNGEQVQRWLLDGKVGLAVLAGRPPAPQLEVAAMFEDLLVLIAAPDHPLAGRPVDPAELAGERFLLREAGSATRQLQEAELARWGLGEVATGDIWGTETLKQAVGAGMGLSLISEHAVTRDVALGALALIDVRPAPPARPIVVAHRRDRLLSPAESAFLRLLEEQANWPR